MRRRAQIIPFVLLASLVPALVGHAGGDAAKDARDCVERLGAALQSGDARQLAPMLPERGKVKLRLVRLGSEQGSFSAGQVQAILKDFFKNGSVTSFRLAGPSEPTGDYALIRARAEVLDRDGMPSTIDLHLVLGVEGDRWVLREIGEAQR